MSRATNPHCSELECMIHNFHKNLEKHFTQGGEQAQRLTAFEDDPLKLLQMIRETTYSLRRDAEENEDKMGMMMVRRQTSKKNSRYNPLELKPRKTKHDHTHAPTHTSHFSPQIPNPRRMTLDTDTPSTLEGTEKVIPAKQTKVSASKSNSLVSNSDNSIPEPTDNSTEKARKKNDITALSKGLTEGPLEVVNSEEEDFNGTENDESQDLLAAKGKTKDPAPAPEQKFYTMTDDLANQI
jgi:hypothetical protein